jgi:DNA-binding transcriptional LysR family regulator
VEVRQLRYFVAVAEELNFTRAAGRLKMAQPPLSIQMKQLEADLGVELFDRSRRAIRLTDAGRALLPEAQRLLDQLDETAAMVQRVGSGAVGRLAIGFIPAASNSALPPLLRSFGARAPHVELYLREMTPDAIVRAVAEDHIDVGFLYLPVDNPELEVCVVHNEPLVAVIPSDHRLAGRSRIAARELARDSFILPTRHAVSGLHAEILAVCERAGFVPTAVQKEVWLMQTVLGLVAAGIGVALEPASVRNLRRTGVVYLPLWDASEVSLAAAWRREHNSAVLREFLRVLHMETTKKPSRHRLVAS